MNSDLQTMIKLQERWSAMLSSKASIDKIDTKIRSIQDGADNARSSLDKMSAIGREHRLSVKRHENELNAMEEKIANLDKRKNIIRNEKELRAIEKEIDVLRFDAGTTEEKALSLMEELDDTEKKITELEEVLRREELRLEEEKSNAESLITGHQESIRINQEAFNVLIDRLPASSRSKFQKMLGSREGVGIARVEGEICGFCNCKIPAHLAIDAGKESGFVNCTNCGRYIYK